MTQDVLHSLLAAFGLELSSELESRLLQRIKDEKLAGASGFFFDEYSDLNLDTSKVNRFLVGLDRVLIVIGERKDSKTLKKEVMLVIEELQTEADTLTGFEEQRFFPFNRANEVLVDATTLERKELRYGNPFSASILDQDADSRILVGTIGETLRLKGFQTRVSVETAKYLDSTNSSVEFVKAVNNYFQNLSRAMGTPDENQNATKVRETFSTFGFPVLQSTQPETTRLQLPVKTSFKVPYTETGVRFNASMLLKGDLSALTDYMLPLNYSVEELLGIVSAFTELLSDERLLRLLLEDIVTPNIARGRTKYNQSKPILVSQVFTALNNRFSELKVSVRAELIIPCISILLAELGRTGLISADVEFDITYQRPEIYHFDVNYFSKVLIIEEFRELLNLYSKSLQQVEYGEAFVSAADIEAQLLRARLVFLRDIESIGLIPKAVKRAQLVALASALEIPIPFLLTSPTLKQNRLVQEMIGNWEFLQYLIDDFEILELLRTQNYSIEFIETLRWIESRAGRLSTYLKDFTTIKDEFYIRTQQGHQRRLPTVVVNQRMDDVTKVLCARPLRFKAGNTMSLSIRSRANLTKELNNMFNSISAPVSGSGFERLLDSIVDFGALPYGSYAMNARSADALKKLTVNLDNNMLHVEGIDFLDRYRLEGFNFDNVQPVPGKLRAVYKIAARYLSNGSYIVPAEYVYQADYLTSLYSLCAETSVKQVATKTTKEFESSIFLSEQLGHLISPLLLNDKAVDFTFTGEFNDLKKKIMYNQTLNQLLPFDLVKGSAYYIQTSGYAEASSNLAFLIRLVGITERNMGLTATLSENQRLVFDNFYFDLLATMVGSDTLTKLVGLVGAEKIAVIISGEVKNTFVELEPITETLILNTAVANFAEAVNKKFNLIEADLFTLLITRAKSSTSWLTKRLITGGLAHV